MSTNHEHNGEDESRGAQRTAHALGQTEGAELAAVEREMAASPKARQEVEAVAALAARLKDAAQSAPPVEPSPALRAAVEERLNALESAAAKPSPLAPLPKGERNLASLPWWRRRLAALAAAACLAILAVPIALSMKSLMNEKPREVAKAPAASSTAAPALTKEQIHERLAGLVDQYNHLMQEERYAEAEAIGKKAKELAPDELVCKVMVTESRLQLSGSRDSSLKETNHTSAMIDVDQATVPPAIPRGRDGLLVLNSDEAKKFGNVHVAGGAIDLTQGAMIATTSSFGFAPSEPPRDLYLNGYNQFSGGTAITGGALAQATPQAPAMGLAGSMRDRPDFVGSSGTRHIAANGKPLDPNASLGGPTVINSLNGNIVAAGSAPPSNGNARTPVNIEKLEGLDVLVLSGKGQDIARAAGNTKDVEFQSQGNRQPAETTTGPGMLALGDRGDESADRYVTQSVQLHVSPEAMAAALAALAPEGVRIEQPKAGSVQSEKSQQIPNRAFGSMDLKTPMTDGGTLVLSGTGTVSVASGPATAIASGVPRKAMLATGGGTRRKTPATPVETWKPARVVPNASRLMVGDKEELELKGMQVDVRVDGFRARVLLDLYYFNDRPQQLEGNFQLRLPDEATPYFFAFGKTVYQAPQVTANDSMFFKPQQVSLGDTTPEKILALRGNSWEQPKVARMVPKEKAALAYRDTVRRRIDPALVEWSGAGVFQCRVFPLTAQSLHRVTIGYDVDLVRVGDDLELRLDLPEWRSASDAPATVVDLNVAATDARQVSLDYPATTSPDGRRVAYRLVDPKERPLAVRLRKPGTLLLTGNDQATGDYFATRVKVPLADALTPSPSPSGRGELANRADRAVFLVDTSLSAGPQFPLWTKMLRATLENNRDQIKQFAVLFFNVETFWWQEKYVGNTPENVAAVLDYADNLALEGATDLGRALAEAARPKWRKDAKGPAPDFFLLSDGAATWGEDRWPLLAAELTGPLSTTRSAGAPERARVRADGGSIDNATTLTPSPSPKGRGERCSAVFAYHTGLAGGDSRLLAYLAERTGGAVFSLVGEAEIAAASVAHHNRPWKLTNIEMAGSRDLLVAGRPQYVFPGQQLTIVGRLEGRVASSAAQTHQEAADIGQEQADIGGSSLRSTPPYVVLTLQQGEATQTIKIPMERVLASELAARTYGQVATNQLEDVCGVQQTAEPVATAYARHFRITGRTCSLLMLESEQDYARFNIKPEEDSYVVKERPADTIVGKAIAEAVAAMSDPKATFLAWYNRLASSEVRFDLPASLKVYIDSLPVEAFAVAPQPLVCKLRLRHELPANLQQPWQTGMPDYETLDAESQRRLAAYGPDDALRCLSSLVEERPGDAALARDLAFTAIDWQRPGEAYHLLRRAATARTFEPVSFHAMAHCLEQMGRAELAVVYYELACGGQWDSRFGDMHNIALLDYTRFLWRVTTGDVKSALRGYAESRLATLAAMNLRDTADVAALIFWNTDGTDVDLHVVEPGGEECFFSHTQTALGGHISRDVTTGYGPELYVLPKAAPGRYDISAHYFATDMNRASTRTKVLAFIYENWGTKDERLTIKSLALTGRSEKHELGAVKR